MTDIICLQTTSCYLFHTCIWVINRFGESVLFCCHPTEKRASDVITQTNKMEWCKFEAFTSAEASFPKTGFETKILRSFSACFSQKTLMLSDSCSFPITYTIFRLRALRYSDHAMIYVGDYNCFVCTCPRAFSYVRKIAR